MKRVAYLGGFRCLPSAFSLLLLALFFLVRPADAGDLTVDGNLIVNSNLTVNGTLIGNGAGITNLNASQIAAGQLPVAVMPTGGVWNASNMLLTNVVLMGDGAGLTGITASQVGALPITGGIASNLTVFGILVGGSY